MQAIDALGEDIENLTPIEGTVGLALGLPITKIVEKIAMGKVNKFINDNTLLNQEWIMEPKKKVSDVIKEVVGKDKMKIKKFVRYKVGEGL